MLPLFVSLLGVVSNLLNDAKGSSGIAFLLSELVKLPGVGKFIEDNGGAAGFIPKLIAEVDDLKLGADAYTAWQDVRSTLVKVTPEAVANALKHAKPYDAGNVHEQLNMEFHQREEQTG